MGDPQSESKPEDDAIVPVPTPEPDEEGTLPQYVTTLAPVEGQVGAHVIAALQDAETVAVLTTVAMGGDGHQRIVSIGLDAELLGEVQDLLRGEEQQRSKRKVPCVGFHCRVDDPDENPDDDSDEATS